MSKSEAVVKMSEARVRRDLQMRLSHHLDGRLELGLSAPEKGALVAELARSWPLDRARLVLALTDEPNKWTTLRTLARELGWTKGSAAARWFALQQIVVNAYGKTFSPFRKGIELRFRHSKGDVVGGICLHLGADAPMTFSEERKITETTRAATASLAANFGESNARQEQIAPSAERVEIARDREETLRGVSGEQLGLALVKKTGT